MADRRVRVAGRLRYIDLHKKKGLGNKRVVKSQAVMARRAKVSACLKDATTTEARKQCFRQ